MRSVDKYKSCYWVKNIHILLYENKIAYVSSLKYTLKHFVLEQNSFLGAGPKVLWTLNPVPSYNKAGDLQLNKNIRINS